MGKYRGLRYRGSPDVISCVFAILNGLYLIGKATEDALLAHPDVQRYLDTRKQNAIRQAFFRLKREQLIDIQEGKTKLFRLTKLGSRKAFLAHVAVERLQYQKPTSWDGGWRLVIFDIPEKRRHQRDFLRDLLKGLGFYQLQLSTWITPHPIPDFFLNILLEEGLSEFTRILHVSEMDYDKDLRKRFDVKSSVT